jgi:hypothetical protein
MNPLIQDYFLAEPAIVARLKERVQGVKEFYTPFSLADMVESSQASPAIHVIYGGDVIPGGRDNQVGQGTMRTLDQRWLIVLAVRTAKAQLQNTFEIRALAGRIVPQVLGALQGWAPVEWMRPLGRVSGPPAGYSSSFAYFPFMFEGRVIT